MNEPLPEISENEALDICYEDFLMSVCWYCKGIKAGHPNKKIDPDKYAKYIILEIARRIEEGEQVNGILEKY